MKLADAVAVSDLGVLLEDNARLREENKQLRERLALLEAQSKGVAIGNLREVQALAKSAACNVASLIKTLEKEEP